MVLFVLFSLCFGFGLFSSCLFSIHLRHSVARHTMHAARQLIPLDLDITLLCHLQEWVLISLASVTWMSMLAV